MFDGIFEAIEEWMRGLLIGVIHANLDRMFTDVNEKTGEIAGQVGMTPQNWNSTIFNMIHNLSDSVIVPIAGMIITYHLISYLTAKYGEFTYEDVKDELPALLQQQYVLETSSQTETVTETRTITVGQSLGQVVTSGYCSCSICCGQWAGGATASGVMPQANHTLAVDARNPIVPLGTKVVMNGVEYTVEDTGAFARYGVDFDVYYGNHSEAQAHGHQTWEAYLADSNGSQSVEVTQTTTKRIFNVKLTKRSGNKRNRSRKCCIYCM